MLELLRSEIVDVTMLRSHFAPALADCAIVMGRPRTSSGSSGGAGARAEAKANVGDTLHTLVLACFELLADQLGAAETATFIVPQLLRWLYEKELDASEARAVGRTIQKMTFWVVRLRTRTAEEEAAVSCLLCTVTFHANHAHNLTRSP